ncbi:MAG: CPBP family intramembrane glutamic endopeptidase, partial [Planctomycetota bacterium]
QFPENPRDDQIGETSSPGRTPAIESESPVQDVNPYSSSAGFGQDPFEAQELTSSEPSVGVVPRIWTPVAMIGLSLIVYLVASFVMAIVAVYVVHGGFDVKLLTDPQSLADVMRSPKGLPLMVVVPQLFLVVPCLLAAAFSADGFFKRLSLVRGSWPVWGWFAAAVATPLVGMISSILVGLLVDESENLRELSEVFHELGNAGFLIPLIAMIAVTPAFCEELLFRGYVQTRLVAAMPAWVGILVSSVVFAGFHVDPVHVISVFPLGFYLGLVAWHSGTIFPAILGHFINNAFSVVLVTLGTAEEAGEVLAAPAIGFMLVIIGFGFVGGLGTLAIVATRRPSSPLFQTQPIT